MIKESRSKYLVLNGPNLNLLGTREPDIYGRATLKDMELAMKERAKKLQTFVDFKQTNHEGELIDWIQQADRRYQGIILNAGGYTHTSVAIRDAIVAVDIPVIEVHVSNPQSRESFRHTSLITPVAEGQIAGLGIVGYELALMAFISMEDESGQQPAAPAPSSSEDDESGDRKRGRSRRGGRDRNDRNDRNDRDRDKDRDRGRSRDRDQKGDDQDDVNDQDDEQSIEEEERETKARLEKYDKISGVSVRRAVDVIDDADDDSDGDRGGNVEFADDEESEEEDSMSIRAGRGDDDYEPEPERRRGEGESGRPRRRRRGPRGQKLTEAQIAAKEKAEAAAASSASSSEQERSTFDEDDAYDPPARSEDERHDEQEETPASVYSEPVRTPKTEVENQIEAELGIDEDDGKPAKKKKKSPRKKPAPRKKPSAPRTPSVRSPKTKAGEGNDDSGGDE